MVALNMTESEFVATIEGFVKGIDKSATIIPLQAGIVTNVTAVKSFKVGILSPTEKSEEMFAVLKQYALENRKVVEYRGWALSVEDKTFKTVIHTIEAKLHERGC